MYSVAPTSNANTSDAASAPLSLYLGLVPMNLTSEMLKDIIENKSELNLGKVKNIDLVRNRVNPQQLSAFIHFESWNDDSMQVFVLDKEIKLDNGTPSPQHMPFRVALLNRKFVSFGFYKPNIGRFTLKFTVNKSRPIVNKMNPAQLENEVRLAEGLIKEAKAKIEAIESGVPLPGPEPEAEASPSTTETHSLSLFMPAVPKELLVESSLRNLIQDNYKIGTVKRIDYAPNPNSAGKSLGFIHFDTLNLSDSKAAEVIDTINQKGKISMPYSNPKKTGTQVSGLLFIKNKKPLEDAKTELSVEELETNLAKLQEELKVLSDKLNCIEVSPKFYSELDEYVC